MCPWWFALSRAPVCRQSAVVRIPFLSRGWHGCDGDCDDKIRQISQFSKVSFYKNVSHYVDIVNTIRYTIDIDNDLRR